MANQEHLKILKTSPGKGQFEKACLELKRACELGECEYYVTKIRGGVCQ